MGISAFVAEYGSPVGLAALALLMLFSLLAVLSRRGIAVGLWRSITSHPVISSLLAIGLLLLVSFLTYLGRQDAAERFRAREARDLRSPANLLVNPELTSSPSADQYLALWNVTGVVTASSMGDIWYTWLAPNASIESALVAVGPGDTYRYSLHTFGEAKIAGGVDVIGYWPRSAHLRFLWLDAALRVVSWDDSRVLESDQDPRLEGFHTGVYKVPCGATHLKLSVSNIGTRQLGMGQLKLSQQGVYVEQYPNGTQGSIAFSFDWESTMGGAIHSKGMEQHDAKSATEHGLQMRQGANWLNSLFQEHGVKATFYGTGYNLLDGNMERRLFSGDPTYQWAKPKNGWVFDYWLTHKWYGDDPYGNYQTEPAWYFGDQTRDLLKAGHEIGSHTFGHLYVRGAKPQELATDMDEWLAAAKTANVPPPTTFAFPWRSSNSLTPDFYDVLYKRGIRAVTRVYERDLKDLYTVSAVPTYTNMLIMPDFLLGAPSAAMGEEAAGNVIGLEKGLQVISETLARRGTTSFWTHPEQLAPTPELESVRKAWEGVVSAAVGERDRGRLWIAPVADIIAYQTDIMSVTTSLEQGFLGIGAWKVQVHNNSGKELQGVTLTMPGDVVKASSQGAEVLTVYHPDAKDQSVTQVSAPGQPVYPARQLVLSKLKPGVTTIEVEWAADQKPLP